MRTKFLITLLAGLPGLSQEKITLESAVAIALKGNPRLEADRVSSIAAGELVNGVRSSLYPTVVASTTAAGAADESRLAAGALNNPIIFNRYAAGASISQLITDFGRTTDLVHSARQRALSQQENVNTSRAQLVLAVHRAYFSVLRSAGVLRVAEETVRARTLALEQISALANSNLRSTLDVSFAEVNLSEAKLAVLTASNERRQSLADLSVVMGFSRPRQLELEDVPSPSDPPPDVESVITAALQKRPEIAALRLEREAAVSLANAEKKLNLPTVTALANMGVAPVHDDRLKSRYAAGAINLSFPVFNGGLFSARQREADLRVQAIDLRLRDIENQIVREATAAVLAAEAAFERINLTSQLLKQAALTAELAQERYELGLSSIVELSQAQLNETAAQMRSLAARYDYLIQRSVVAYQAGSLP